MCQDHISVVLTQVYQTYFFTIKIDYDAFPALSEHPEALDNSLSFTHS